MTTREIEALLQRYYEGKTSLKEEYMLKEYFKGEDVPDHLAGHRSVFRYFGAEAKTGVSEKFEETLKENIGGGALIRMKPSGNRLVLKLSIAATIALIAALVTLFRLGIFTPSQPYGTITDPQLAYAEVKSALFLVSSRLNDGLSRAHPLEAFSDGLQKMEELGSFRTGLEELNKFNQLDKYQPIIINPGRTASARP